MLQLVKKVQPLAQSWWFACFLIVQVIGLGQLYQYVHIHHVHEDADARLVVSIHPPSLSEEFLDIHSEDEHHHAFDHLSLDCHLCQRSLNQLLRQTDIVVSHSLSIEPVVKQAIARHIADSPLPYITRSVIPFELRGPPSSV